MYKSLLVLSLIVIVSQAAAENHYTQPRNLGKRSGHIKHLDAGLTKTQTKHRRTQAATATVAAPAPAPAATVAAPAPAATATVTAPVATAATPAAPTTNAAATFAPAASVVPIATTTAAATPTATPKPTVVPKAAPSVTPGSATTKGDNALCAVATLVGGHSTSKPSTNTSDICTYNPNLTCCDNESFENMRQWWQETPKVPVVGLAPGESRSGRYHRRIKESIRYTKYLLGFYPSIVTIAEKNQAVGPTADPECQSAAKEFKRIRLAPNLLNTYSHYAELCMAHLVGYTNAAICATCDPTASTFMDGTKQTITLEKQEAKGIATACTEVVALQEQVINRYLDAADRMVRCDAGQIVTGRPLYSRKNCLVSSDVLAKCRGTSAAVSSISADTLPEDTKTKKKVAKLPGTATAPTATAAKARRLQSAQPTWMSITAPVDHIEENCYDFAAGVLNFSIYKINVCTIGDPDFIRGIYMNTLHAKALFTKATFSPTQIADNAATILSDSVALRSDAAQKAAAAPVTVAAPAATATVAAPAATATVAAPTATATVAAPAATATVAAPATSSRRLWSRKARLGTMKSLINRMRMARALSEKGNKKDLRTNLRILQDAQAKATGDDEAPLGNDNLSKFTVQFAASGFNISPNIGKNKLAQVTNLQLNKVSPTSMPAEAFGNLLRLNLSILVALSMIFI